MLKTTFKSGQSLFQFLKKSRTMQLRQPVQAGEIFSLVNTPREQDTRPAARLSSKPVQIKPNDMSSSKLSRSFDQQRARSGSFLKASFRHLNKENQAPSQLPSEQPKSQKQSLCRRKLRELTKQLQTELGELVSTNHRLRKKAQRFQSGFKLLQRSSQTIKGSEELISVISQFGKSFTGITTVQNEKDSSRILETLTKLGHMCFQCIQQAMAETHRTAAPKSHERERDNTDMQLQIKLRNQTLQIQSFERDNQRLQVKLRRMEKEHGSLILEKQTLSRVKQSELNAATNQISSLKSQIEGLKSVERDLKHKIIEIERESGDFTNSKIRTAERKSQSVSSEQERFFLNEIAYLKATFTEDMEKVNELFAFKEQTYKNTIYRLEQELKRKLTITPMTELGRKSSESNVIVGELQSALTKQQLYTDELARDLRRANEQLFKHWEGLRDIKTLLQRLSLYDKFSCIFRDIKFNDFLFG